MATLDAAEGSAVVDTKFYEAVEAALLEPELNGDARSEDDLTVALERIASTRIDPSAKSGHPFIVANDDNPAPLARRQLRPSMLGPRPGMILAVVAAIALRKG